MEGGAKKHLTHEIIIFELFRGLHYSFWGVFELIIIISCNCSLVLLTRIQLEEIIPLSDFQSFFAITVT